MMFEPEAVQSRWCKWNLCTPASDRNDKQVVVWKTGRWESMAVIAGHSKRVTSAWFRQDGKILATGDSDWNVKLWRLQDKD